MIIEFFRSSSYNNWDYCAQQYFLNYVLGLPRSESKKALKGTIAHKVLECLAIAKQALDKDLSVEYIDLKEDIGEYRVYRDKFTDKRILDDDEILTINRTRKNKYTYKHKCHIAKGSHRNGDKIVNDLIRMSYDVYSKKCEGWEPVDIKDISNFVWMALEYKHGMFDPRYRTIVAPEQPFDITIKKDWAKYDYIHPQTGEHKQGHLTIRGTMDLITKINDEMYEIVDWKGLPIDTPIPIPSGWTTMGGLQVGDDVFDKDGNIVKVLAKSQVKVKPCYEIEFDDTSTVICDDEHQWLLNNGNTVKTTELKVKDAISVSKPLNTQDVILPIDPYVLGQWLGDGRNKNGEICSGDPFVYEEIQRRGYTVGDNINKGNSAPSRTVFGLVTELKKLGLLHNKHIPTIYLRASFKQRLDLLRGLMDSDGNANPTRKQGVFTNCNKRLSDNVVELLLTLGQRPNQATITKWGFGLQVEVYPVHFRPIDINPFLLPRKADRIDPTWGSGESHRRMIAKITQVPDKKTQCIMVDSPSSTYLCTRHMIPTHNSGQRLDWATGQPKDFKKLSTDFQLMLYHYAARHVFKDIKHIVVTIFFMRDGGPFTLCFDDDHLDKTEELLAERFEEIKKCQLPKMCDHTQRDFRCKSLCDYYDMASPDPKFKNFCTYAHNYTKLYGIDQATKDLTHKGHDINYYESPGGV